mmetsp:Transcript_51061/g.141389  ORF Transcript_51061/g.141389 Transcript_51061/m.141389 type:complete len:213 (+) Transcript_51061:617-1255(+)
MSFMGSTPVSRCTFRAGCSARMLCSSFAFSRELSTARADRFSIFLSNPGKKASKPFSLPCFCTLSNKVSASKTASVKAWFAPCARNGVIGWAASPIKVTRLCSSLARRSTSGCSKSRSYTGYPAKSSSSVPFSRAGMGSCHFSHRFMISAFSSALSLQSFLAAFSLYGNESCHIVDVFVKGIVYIRVQPSTVSKMRRRVKLSGTPASTKPSS